MTAVYYSLACDAEGVRERQWARGVRSLRWHNEEIDVVLCLYGGAGQETLELARSARVHVEPMGEYPDAFGDVPAHWRAALSTYPPLHKLLSLRRIVSMRPDRVLYLDCDTYCFGDVAQLVDRHSGCEWYAREEPGSSRSHYGYDASYIDELALGTIARSEGLVSIPPYNTGVFTLSGELAGTLAELRDDFVWYAWRLLLGACLWRPELVADPALVSFVRERSGPAERRLALPFPSRNGWIVEELATWLTLGRVPGMTHDVLRRCDVVQNGEYADSDEYLLAHYFTAGEAQFFARLDATGEAP